MPVSMDERVYSLKFFLLVGPGLLLHIHLGYHVVVFVPDNVLFHRGLPSYLP